MGRSVVLAGAARCPRCSLPPRWCTCDILPAVETQIAVEVLIHRLEQCRPSSTGNLVGRSLTMMSGYKNRPDKTAEAQWTDPATGEGWMRMGDVGRVDTEGFVELVGRAKDMIISGGFNIYPSDIEAVLLTLPQVVEAAVVGVASEAWGETPVAFVVAPGADAEALRAAANAKVGKTQRLAAVVLVDELPRSHIGKVLKRELRDSFTGKVA